MAGRVHYPIIQCNAPCLPASSELHAAECMTRLDRQTSWVHPSGYTMRLKLYFSRQINFKDVHAIPQVSSGTDRDKELSMWLDRQKSYHVEQITG